MKPSICGKLIGKGAFTRCYEHKTDPAKVVLISNDPIKECISFGWFTDSDLFPVIERLDYLESGDSVFVMERYQRVRSLKTSLDPDQYQIYKTLRNVFNNLPIVRNKNDSYDILYKEFEKIGDVVLMETMREALESCANYGYDIGFEISPRNVAVKNSKLVLLDVFFIKSKLIENRTK